MIQQLWCCEQAMNHVAQLSCEGSGPVHSGKLPAVSLCDLLLCPYHLLISLQVCPLLALAVIHHPVKLHVVLLCVCSSSVACFLPMQRRHAQNSGILGAFKWLLAMMADHEQVNYLVQKQYVSG